MREKIDFFDSYLISFPMLIPNVEKSKEEIENNKKVH